MQVVRQMVASYHETQMRVVVDEVSLEQDFL